jgi:hypothetical protein
VSFLYTSLRGKAPKWHECLKRSGGQLDFSDYKTAFVESFYLARTIGTATVKLHEVKQQPKEDVSGFMLMS